MTSFPRQDYASLTRYDPERSPVDVDLSDNTNLWGTHPAALQRIQNASTEDLARYPELYADSLREAVAQRFGIDAEAVTTGAGSDDVLDSAYRAVWGPGTGVSYPAPTFSMVGTFATMNGLEARPVDWAEALADPGRLLDGDPALVYICRPNNPTGALAPREWVEAVLDEGGATGPLVIVDEAYADFAGESLIEIAPSHPRLVVARTLSKAYGLAGLRCGFAVARPDVILEIDKSRGPYKVSRLAIEAAAAAVRDEEGWMRQTVAEAIGARRRLERELGLRGLTPLESHANFVLMPAPSGDAGADAGALRASGVGVRPFRDVPGLGDALRVTVGPLGMTARFLAALDERLRSVGGTTMAGGSTGRGSDDSDSRPVGEPGR